MEDLGLLGNTLIYRRWN